MSSLTPRINEVETNLDNTELSLNNLINTFNDSQKTANGYLKLPGGIIIQWCRGVAQSAEVSQVVNFPIPFPNNILTVQVTSTGNSRDSMYQLEATSLTNVTVFLNNFNSGAGTLAPWVLAIGF